MNVQTQFLPAVGDSEYQAAEKVAFLNQEFVEKVVSYQLDVANDMLDRGLSQFKLLSEAKDLGEVVKAQGAYVEEATQRGLESTQKLIEIMNESGQAYKVLYQDNRIKGTVVKPVATKSKPVVESSTTPKRAAPKRAARSTSASKPAAKPVAAKPARGAPAQGRLRT